MYKSLEGGHSNKVLRELYEDLGTWQLERGGTLWMYFLRCGNSRRGSRHENDRHLSFSERWRSTKTIEWSAWRWMKWGLRWL